jgi:hypothetical protein
MNYFSQSLKVHIVSDIRPIEVHTAEPLVLGPSRLEAEIVIAKLKKYKLPGIDQIPAELIQAGDKILLSTTYKLINSICNKEKFPDQLKKGRIGVLGYIGILYHKEHPPEV